VPERPADAAAAAEGQEEGEERPASKAGSAAAEEAAEEEKEPPPPPPRGEADVGTTRLDDGEWHHVAVTYASGRLRAFVDGQLDGEAALEVTGAPSAVLALGPLPAEDAEAGAAVEGMKDVQAYSVALSDAQVADLVSGRKVLPCGAPLLMLPRAVAEYWALTPAKPKDAALEEPGEGMGLAPQPTPEARKLLEEALGLGDEPRLAFQREVTSSLFVDLLDFARATAMTPQKAAVAVAILAATLDAMKKRSTTTSRVGEPFSSSETFLEYRRMLLANTAVAAAADPTSGIGILSTSEARQLTEFMSGTLFQHLLLYQGVLVCAEESTVTCRVMPLAELRPLPDLKLATLNEPPADAPPRSRSHSQVDGAANAEAADSGDPEEEEQEEVDEYDLEVPPDSGDKTLTVDQHHLRVTKLAAAKLAKAIAARDEAVSDS